MSDIFFNIIGRDRASQAFRNVGRSAQQANGQVGGFGHSLKSHLGSLAALTGASLGAGALIGFAKSAIDTEKSYSTSMRSIKAATGATGAQIDKLNKQAIELGQKTVFSAGDAANAMLELGKAGQNTGQIMQAVPQVMNLAATEGMGLADAAGIVTSALAQFGLKAKKSAVVVNALAGASNASKASVASMSQALNYSGAASHAVGLSVQQTAGALAALAQHGQEGSMAGTSLSSVFNHLQPQTTKAANAMHDLGIKFVNADGSFKSIAQIAQILQSKLGGLSPAARKADISAIFGRNAGSIAAVLALMNEGAKGINKYTKASSDMNAAARLSAARMGGTAGAIEQLNGSIDTAKLKLGQALAPMVIKVSNYLAQHLVPAMDNTISFAKDFGSSLGATVIPPLKIVGKLVLDAAKFFNGLPGPLKSVGIEAGIAALVMPRLAAGVSNVTTSVGFSIARFQQFRAELTYTATRGAAVSAMMTKLGNAARSAAGVAGMVALTEGAKTSNKALGFLEQTAGGAAMGFAVGGPWGAAIGAAGGALMSLTRHTDAATTAAKVNQATLRKIGAQRAAKAAYDDLRSTLNQTTGAYTRDTNKAIENWLQTSKAGKQAAAALHAQGVGNRTIIASLLGSPEANKRVAAALHAQIADLNRTIRLGRAAAQAQPGTTYGNAGDAQAKMAQKQKDALLAVQSSLTGYRSGLEKAGRATRNFRRDTAPISQLLHMTKKTYDSTFSKRVRGELKLDGVPKTLTGIKEVSKNVGGLTRREWKVLLKAAGVDATAKQLTGLARTSGTVKTKIQKDSSDTGTLWSRLFGQGVTAGKPKVASSMQGVVTSSSSGTSSIAKTSGTSLGSFYATGYVQGILDKVGPAYTAGYNLGSAAKRGTKAAQKSNSPSKVAHKLGRDFGDGYHGGLRASNGGAMSAGAQLVESLVKGIDKHKVRVKDVMGKLASYISAQSSKISNLMSKRQGIIDSVKGFSSSVFGATFQDAEGNDRAGSVQDLLNFQATQRANAEQLQGDIKTLLGQHLSSSLINQFLSEGAAGAANLHTLAGASAAQIAQLNRDNAATSASLTAGGNAVSGALGVNSDIRQAKKDKATAEALATEFRKVLKEEKKDVHVYVEIDGHRLHTVLLKERAKTKKPLGLG